MKRVIPITVTAALIVAIASAAYALGGQNISGANGTSAFAAQNLYVNLNSIQVERIQLVK